MFIRKRQVKGRYGKVYTYYGIVETHRENGKVRQKLLYNMGKLSTVAECIQEAQKDLNYWRSQDQAKLEKYAAMGGFRLDRDHVAKRCAHYQAEIDWLKDAATRVTKVKPLRHLSLWELWVSQQK
jgi:hypothetical protein